MKKPITAIFLSVMCIICLADEDEDVKSSFEYINETKLIKIQAQQSEIDEDYKKAAKLYGKAARRSKDFRSRAELFLKRADCLFDANKTHQALEAYKDLMQTYPLYIPFNHVVERLRTLAERYQDGNGTFLGIRDEDSAIGVYQLILMEAPAINVSLKDRITLAKLLVKNNREEEAVAVYQEILKLDPTQDDARLELANILNILSKQGDGDGTIKRATVRQARIILERNPSYARRPEVELILADAREQEAQRLLNLATFYLKSSHLAPNASRKYLMDTIKLYPGTKASWEAKDILDNNEHFKKPDTPDRNDAPGDAPKTEATP